MPPTSRVSRVSRMRAIGTAYRLGNLRSLQSAIRARAVAARRGSGRAPVHVSVAAIQRRLNNIDRAIETKEGCRRITNVQLAHNNVTVFNDADGNVFNPFICSQGAADPMANGAMQRVGDKIQVKGMLFKFMVEGSLSRSKVYFRFMLVKMAKGDTLNRANLFKNACANKMIDQTDRERFTIIAQKVINVSPPNSAPTGAQTVPTTGIATGSVPGVTGSRVFKMWVPGKAFGKGGNITYENASTNQVKFFDYRLCCVAYDWYGTPQDINNVGFVNDGFVKVYFKDA